ncbi:hypothetical protein [Streptomyces fagopyri]|nr:hypothetical protein [Streptomyces fagopyri]
MDRPPRLGNHARLPELAHPHGDMADVTSAHGCREPARHTDGGARAGTE